MDTVSRWLAGSILVSVTLIYLIFARWHDVKGTCFIRPNQLKTTSGVVVSSGTLRRRNRSRFSTHYDINYEFEVNKVIYESNEITFSFTGRNEKSFAESYVQNYPVGKKVTVFYESGNPSFSVVEPDSTETSFWGVIIALLISLSSTFWFLREKILEKQNDAKTRAELSKQ